VSGFTRMTLVGSSTRADVAVPEDEAIGVLLPRLLDLLGEASGPVTRPLALVRLDGSSLDLAATAEAQALRPGEIVRVTRADAAPPPPEVAQVTDVLGVTSGIRTGRWSDSARRRTGILAVGGLAVVSVLVAGRPLAAALSPGPARLVPLAVAAAACLVAVGCGLGRWRWGVAAATAVALGCALPGAVLLALPERLTVVNWILPVGTAVALVTWACLGICLGLVLARRGAVAGSVLGVVVLLLPLAAGPLGSTRAAAAGAVVAVLALGLLPRYALAVAGLPRLEEDALRGELSPWGEVQKGIDDAYAALTWSTTAASVGLAVTVGTLLASADPWAVGLAAAVLAVTALRTRTCPLTAQHAVLWGSVAVALAHGLAARATGLSVGDVAMGVGPAFLLVAGLVIIRPPEHLRATLRRVGDVSEVLAVVALAPLVVGVFGIYADLIERFR
jgi:hypothetical protein